MKVVSKDQFASSSVAAEGSITFERHVVDHWHDGSDEGYCGDSLVTFLAITIADRDAVVAGVWNGPAVNCEQNPSAQKTVVWAGSDEIPCYEAERLLFVGTLCEHTCVLLPRIVLNCRPKHPTVVHRIKPRSVCNSCPN
ncbi:unnamed protein product [Nippostrongylus brasiliensis]|uniref:Uncharacterized protein n=1 Tax=Nippostrongylus brasiliensis TaxID=27835 RepID=A0A0N4YBN3_NIPBR|nr:hypothetical protein Q1695_008540 [Nippostrongylus brasiliensis]VDL77474.1 unnamed protein product [Nippostrongylus brasiliensis]